VYLLTSLLVSLLTSFCKPPHVTLQPPHITCELSGVSSCEPSHITPCKPSPLLSDSDQITC
jgi:hypothetical protein